MAQAQPITAEQLTRAFAEFEHVSRALSASYGDLEHEVARLTAELADARDAQAQQLREQARLAARLESLLGALPAGIVVLDQHGRVQESNPAAHDLLGPLTRGEQWTAVVLRCFAPRRDDGHDISLSDGRRVNLATQAMSGEPGQILLLKDVTETRRLQDQLAHHKRLSAKTETAAALAHQVRTPLAAALLNAGNLRRAADGIERERLLDRTLHSLRRLERLVDDMLLFARGGRFEVERTNVSALEQHIAQAAQAAASAEFCITCVPSWADAAVHANCAALVSIAQNLIDNAQQACHGRGQLTIAGVARDGAFELTFADDGPGFEVGVAAHVFEPFFTTRSNGTGLGLAVARAVARAHGGDLTLATSRHGGAGFVLRLPLVESASYATEVTRKASQR